MMSNADTIIFSDCDPAGFEKSPAEKSILPWNLLKCYVWVVVALVIDPTDLLIQQRYKKTYCSLTACDDIDIVACPRRESGRVSQGWM